MANGRFNLPTGKLIALAVVAGMAAGALGVYVMGGRSGNNGAEVASSGSPEDAVCAAKAEAAQATGEAARGEVAAMLPADPPQALAGLAFNAPDGTPMTLADRAGRVLLVNLWATWCYPCREEMPSLDALQKEMGGEDFEVVAVNVDTGDDTKPKKFLSETGIEALGYYRDNTLSLFNDLKTRGLALGLPVTLLVDKDGCLLAHMNGPADWASADAKNLLARVRAM